MEKKLNYIHNNLVSKLQTEEVALASKEKILQEGFNAIKGKKSFFNFEERKTILESIKYVDEVIMEDTWEQKITDIKKYNIDIFVIGNDWEGKFDFLKDYCEVVYLPRTLDISTTQIKKYLQLPNKNDNFIN